MIERIVCTNRSMWGAEVSNPPHVIPDSMIAWRGVEGVVEASTAGLAPGLWPDLVVVVAGEERLHFTRERAIAVRDTLYGVQYRQATTQEVLHILND